MGALRDPSDLPLDIREERARSDAKSGGGLPRGAQLLLDEEEPVDCLSSSPNTTCRLESDAKSRERVTLSNRLRHH